MRRFKDEQVKTQLVSDYGMTAELYIDTGSCEVDNQVSYPLLKVYADEESEERYLEIESEGQSIQVSVKAVMSFLAMSEVEVHSESWYERNVFGRD
ncbi:hypothetical protein [Shewanella chilikensis]|uniref:hypothetical protein n=1 Tax=Shewanella chilikensis TaxID=558541 RepID=UPI00300560AA